MKIKTMVEGKEVEKDIKVYPRMGDVWGSDALTYFGKDFGADIHFAMQDIWTLNPDFLRQIPRFIAYCPIDQEPIPSTVLDRLRYCYKIICFSKFGYDLLLKNSFNTTLIVEGTNVDIFKPMDKIQCRKDFAIPPDAFLFGMVGANKENPPRKGYQEALDAFKIFHDRHNEAIISFHTQQMQPGNFPIMDYAKHLGIEKQVFYLDATRGTFLADSNFVAKEINTFDVLLHPSQTEGFGLLIIEAQSCGKPVVVNNSTSQPELVIPGKTGEICEAGIKRFSSAGGYWIPASVPSLVDKMEIVYKKLHEENTYQQDCRQHIVENYNMDKLVKEKWIPTLESLQLEILGKLIKKEESEI
jgi:glycosyltransferase involved in cell wall biosynthesis